MSGANSSWYYGREWGLCVDLVVSFGKLGGASLSVQFSRLLALVRALEIDNAINALARLWSSILFHSSQDSFTIRLIITFFTLVMTLFTNTPPSFTDFFSYLQSLNSKRRHNPVSPAGALATRSKFDGQPPGWTVQSISDPKPPHARNPAVDLLYRLF